MTDAWIITAALAATGLVLTAATWPLVPTGLRDAWRGMRDARARRRAVARYVAGQGPRVGEWTYYTGPTLRRHDGAVLVMGAAVRVAKRYTLGGVAMARVESYGDTWFAVPAATLHDLWDRGPVYLGEGKVA